ncbi:MAG: DUF2017 family protein [Acidimicrobiia bacterium]|nr:DUF2017 family protein [Acidimicrobiia bacterium]
MIGIGVRGDRIRVELPTDAVAVLTGLPDWLASAGVDPRDPAGPRLNQSPYPDDPVASAEYEIEMDDEIEQRRSADREVFTTTLPRAVEGVELDVKQAEAWMRVVGDARLMLASRLGYTRNEQLNDEATSPQEHLLHYLTYVQSALIDAIGDLLFRD